MENLAFIEVVCPKCSQKAQYCAEWDNSYKRKPLNKGLLTCTQCGLVKEYNLSTLKYFYAVQVQEKYLVARNRDAFVVLYNFFKERKKITDSDLPKCSIRIERNYTTKKERF